MLHYRKRTIRHRGFIATAFGLSRPASPLERTSGIALAHPQVLVVGGDQRQRRRHYGLFLDHGATRGFEGTWLMADYRSPHKSLGAIRDRLRAGRVDLLILLHRNRHETSRGGLRLARKYGVRARVLYCSGFTRLQSCVEELLFGMAP